MKIHFKQEEKSNKKQNSLLVNNMIKKLEV